jgi:hypothetical protein
MTKSALAELITRKHAGWYLAHVEYRQLYGARPPKLRALGEIPLSRGQA